MDVSPSAFYHWLSNRASPNKDVALEIKATEIFNLHKKTLGYRRLTNKLRKEGFDVGHYKIWRLMSRLGLQARYPKRFKVTTDSKHNFNIADNLLNRKFDVQQPNTYWTTDITYVWTLEGWMYLAVVMDLYSRQIIGWSIADNMRTEMCLQALQMAYWRRKPNAGVMHHSDRGSQYASGKYQEMLSTMEMIPSMSGKGECWDNAPTERFFRSFKYEQMHYYRLKTKKDAELCILDYLAYYNSKRPHTTLGYLSPMEFEQQILRKVA